MSNGLGADTGGRTDGRDVHTSPLFSCFVNKAQQFCTYILRIMHRQLSLCKATFMFALVQTTVAALRTIRADGVFTV